MAKFSQKSRNELMSCNGRLIQLFQEVVKKYDCTILEGFRNRQRQNTLYAEGKSKVRFPHSKHNRFPSRAIDVAPFPIDWDDKKRFCHFAGYVKRVAEELNIPIRWGGDWNSNNILDDQDLNDLDHFELKREREEDD